MASLTREEINRLSPPERLELIGELWDSLSDRETPITPAQEQELLRRLATVDEDSKAAVTWGELEAELIRRSP